MAAVNTILGCALEVYLLQFFFSNYFEKRQIFKESVFLMLFVQIITVLLEFVCNCWGNLNYNLIIIPVIFFTYMVVMFKGRLGHQILCYFMFLFIVDGCEFIFIMIVNPDIDHFDRSDFSYALQTLLVKFVSYIIMLIINQIVGRRKRIHDIKILVMYMFIPISSCMVVIATYYSVIGQALLARERLVLTMSYCFLILGNIVSFYAFESYSERLFQNMQQNVVIVRQKKDLEYYMQIAKSEGMQKELIHDINNYIKMINRFAKLKDYQSILKLSGDIRDEMEDSLRKIYCNNSILNTMLNEKQEEAERCGVSTKFYVEPGVVLDMVSPADLIAMLGNLIDNAIRAASEAEKEKFVKVSIYMHKVGGFCVVKIVNSFEHLIRDESGGFLSTQEDEGVHGIGIQNVERLAEKYGGYLNCEAKEETKEFEVVLLISTAQE